MIVVGGINGAGKTTLAKSSGAGIRADQVTFLNPDLETAHIRAATPTLTQNAANLRGLRNVREAIERLMAANQSLLVETVFANQAYLRLMMRAKGLGYSVRLVFYGLATVEHSIARVALRVSEGGHDVPADDIRRRCHWCIATWHLR